MMRIDLGLLVGVLIQILLPKENMAQVVKVLGLGYFTNGDQVIRSLDIKSTQLWLPVATQHFNERYSGIIPELAQLRNTCSVKINFTFVDDAGKAGVAMREVVNHIAFGLTDVIQGPTTSAVAVPISVALGALNIPVISHFATSATLSDRVNSPSFFRTIGADAQAAESMAQLFEDFNYKLVGMLFTNDV